MNTFWKSWLLILQAAGWSKQLKNGDFRLDICSNFLKENINKYSTSRDIPTTFLISYQTNQLRSVCCCTDASCKSLRWEFHRGSYRTWRYLKTRITRIVFIQKRRTYSSPVLYWIVTMPTILAILSLLDCPQRWPVACETQTPPPMQNVIPCPVGIWTYLTSMASSSLDGCSYIPTT